MSEPVCRDIAFAGTDWNVLNVSAAVANPVTAESTLTATPLATTASRALSSS
jgi:hypothetical protein